MGNNIDNYFSSAYNDENFCSILTESFGVEVDNGNIDIAIDSKYDGIIKTAKLLDILEAGRETILVLSVETNDKVNKHKIKDMQREFVANVIHSERGQAAIVAFTSENKDVWKISLVVDKIGLYDKDSIVSETTRYNYLVGKNEPIKTVKDELAKLKEELSINKLIEAFSIEPVTREFRTRYIMAIEEIADSLIVADKELNKDKARIKAEMFVHRLTFTHFIQKKGWLGRFKVEDNGDTAFLTNALKLNCDNLCNEVISPLFKALATGEFSKKPHPKLGLIPHINGGLFDSLGGVDDELSISNKVIIELIETFSRFNFTIDESDTSDNDIAVDINLLGTIFEGLRDLYHDNDNGKDTDKEVAKALSRKDSGTYYTPKDITTFMSRESICQYIATKTGLDIECIEDAANIFETNTGDSKSKITNKLHKDFVCKISEVNEAIKVMTVLEPSVGSGAFLQSILNDIVLFRENIEWLLLDNIDLVENRLKIKKEAIINSLRGVDIQKEAIALTKLRLWLSLIIDAEYDHGCMPNLDTILIVGDTLKGGFVYESNKQTEFIHYRIDDLSRGLLFKEINTNYILETNYRLKSNKLSGVEDLKKKLLYDKLNSIQFKDILLKKYGNRQVLIESLLASYFNSSSDFFNPYLEFYDIMCKGGFDIVLGNPPYIASKRISRNNKEFYKHITQDIFNGSSDIYIAFYKNGIDLLNNSGVLAFITSNTWLSNKYGIKLKETLGMINILLIVDFRNKKIFNSDVYTNILIAKKEDKARNMLYVDGDMY